MLVKCFLDAGVPSKALQLINIKPEDNPRVFELLVSNDIIRKVYFTGSTATGRKIASVAAKYLKPCLLELGGKNFSIATPDADIDRAAGNTLWSAWSHKGQICMRTDKIYIYL